MPRKLIAIALIGLLFLVHFGTALAAGPGDLQLSGQAVTDRSERQARLTLTADSAGAGGWHLDATLSPAASGARSGSRTTGLSGSFTLRGPGGASAAGSASGQLDQGGTGSLKLTGRDGASNLNAAFTVNSAGQLQIDLAGQFPPASASPSGVDSTGQPATSQPATSQPAAGQPVDHTYWYLSRATGFTAYVLLFLDVCLGLAASGRLLSSLLARWQTFDLHQVTGLLSMMFLALHMFALLGDRYVGFDLAQLLVPFASPYRWLWTALGVISFYLLGAVIVSSYLRKYVSSRAWKAIHYSSFAVFLLVLAHSILAGTDTATPWGVLLYVGTGTAVLVLLLARVSRPSLSALAKNTAGDPA